LEFLMFGIFALALRAYLGRIEVDEVGRPILY